MWSTAFPIKQTEKLSWAELCSRTLFDHNKCTHPYEHKHTEAIQPHKTEPTEPKAEPKIQQLRLVYLKLQTQTLDHAFKTAFVILLLLLLLF